MVVMVMVVVMEKKGWCVGRIVGVQGYGGVGYEDYLTPVHSSFYYLHVYVFIKLTIHIKPVNLLFLSFSLQVAHFFYLNIYQIMFLNVRFLFILNKI